MCSSAPATPVTITSDGVVSARRCKIHAVVLTAAAGAPATLVLYDDIDSANGTVLGTYGAVASTSFGIDLRGLPTNAGCYADIGGAGATATVYIE